MSKCWKWRPSSRPSFTALITMLEKGLDSSQEIDYVNLAEIVMGDIDNQVIPKIKLL